MAPAAPSAETSRASDEKSAASTTNKLYFLHLFEKCHIMFVYRRLGGGGPGSEEGERRAPAPLPQEHKTLVSQLKPKKQNLNSWPGSTKVSPRKMLATKPEPGQV